MDHQAAAEHKLKVADHLLSTTYPIVKDPKLLISVIENLYEAMGEAITAVLEHELVLAHVHSAEQRLEMFRRKVVSKHSLDAGILDFVNELKQIIDSHKHSKVEFSKKEKFVITDNNYNLQTLTVEQVKPKVAQARKYINSLFNMSKIAFD